MRKTTPKLIGNIGERLAKDCLTERGCLNRNFVLVKGRNALLKVV
jgi:hypothetical protein